MASSPPEPRRGALTGLQERVLRAFFDRERAFFLTGGAALVGFHLGHRTTSDLDLFTLDDAAFERGRFVLADVASALGARLEIFQDAPGFHRVVLTEGQDALVVDLVRDRSVQLHTQKLEAGSLRIDPPDEVLANKLCALVGRTEERDLVDVLYLERAGHQVESVLPAALAKDGGCTAATLAWVLSQVEIPDGTPLPGNVEASELRDFVTNLVRRLRRAALPSVPPP